MKFGFISEAETAEGQSYFHRYKELIEEVQYADELGYDIFGCSEQHFTFGATVSAPECLFSYLFPLTKHIRFRHAVVLLPYMYNHPLRVAERIATEDLLSHGRVELGTGRGNTTLGMKAFNVNPDETKPQWKEALSVIRTAFGPQPFTFEGHYFKIPKRYMIPQPVQKPYPPISVAATSPDSMEDAAREGIGVMTSSYFFGWGWFEKLAQIYWDTVKSLDEPVAHANYHFSPLLYAYCADSDEEARRDGFEPIFTAARLAAISFSRLAQTSKSYGYMAQADDMVEKINDPQWLIEESGTVVVGSPESCVQQIQRYVDLGATEILLRLDGIGHEKVMRSMELFAKEVMPHFKDELAVVPKGMVKGGLT